MLSADLTEPEKETGKVKENTSSNEKL